MLRCERCRVDLPGDPSRCPLCQNKPVGTPDNSGSRFPNLPVPGRVIVRILAWVAFGSVCAAAA
ncbi:MAG TPA: hypothetical protein PKE04_10340, partial [Clostridia bacterium]|nr:hypothetical protein [Clostridia bacterium]